MAGSLRQRGKTSWQLRVLAGRDEITGNKSYVSKTFRGGRRDAERELARLVAEVEAGSTTAEIVLAHSPDALHVTADRATFGVGDVVNFTVALDPLTSTFVGYNVNEIRIYELLGGATAVKVASAVAADGQWSFSIPWTATHAGTTTAGGLPLLHAFVVPRFLSAIADLLPLELGPVVDAPPVVTPPTIVTPLRDLQAVAGGTATFSVQAAGGGVLSYQWLKSDLAPEKRTPC